MSFKSDFKNATGWNAVDTNKKLTKRGGSNFIKFLKGENVHTIIRYYASSERPKTINLDEARAITAAGFAILPIYQDNNRKKKDFSEKKGEKAAENALKFADRLKQPDRSTILFAVDSDLSKTVINNNVSDYFKGIKKKMLDEGRSFRIGVYGSGLACRTLMNKGLVEVPWLSMSRLFTGTKDFFNSTDWMVRQIPPDTRHSSNFSFDRNKIRVQQSEIGAFTYDASGDGIVVGGAISGGGTLPPPSRGSRPVYPGHVISENSNDNSVIVTLIQRRLVEVGFGPLTDDGDFGSTTRNTVRDFQAENDDLNGIALDVDGEVGKLTWGALFATDEIDAPVPDVSGFTSLAEAFVTICRSQDGVREDRPFKNRGPRVDSYIRSTGLEPFAGNFPWCIAYIYWCGEKLCEQHKTTNPMPQTAGVHRMWKKRKGTARVIVKSNEATSRTVRPGMVFFIDKGNGKGHAGVVLSLDSDRIETIEGNTNSGGAREGTGVFVRRRKIQMASLMGYLDFWQ